jgi:peptidyl-tRNA hydrolase, PTH1 family
MATEYAVIGLGNPGDEYANTRHNIGFMALDALVQKKHNAKKSESPQWVKTCQSLLWTEEKQNYTLHVLKPQTYMNVSVDAVEVFVKRYHIDLSNVLIVYDDIDLPLGRLRIRKSGSGGTHNGMTPITNFLGENIPRLRLGIGPFEGYDLKKFVLGPFTPDERAIVDEVCEATSEIIKLWLYRGLDTAMNQFNKKDFRPVLPAESRDPENTEMTQAKELTP